MDQHVIHLARLNRAGPTKFDLEPDAGERGALAEALGVNGLRKVRLSGHLEPLGKRDWTLTARLGATALQTCVVTLAPVTTRIDVDVSRSYRAELPEPTGEEMEMPEDDSIEALPSQLDLSAVLTEALALALPDYPRADGVSLGEAVFAAPGIVPMTDEDAKPLAGLAALRDRLSDDGQSGENEG